MKLFSYHVVMGFVLALVMTATAHDDGKCQSILEVACHTPEFSTLCAVVQLTGLHDMLSEGHWTVFAPTNRAFQLLGEDLLNGMLSDYDEIREILLFHIVDDVVTGDDLYCSGLIEMKNGQDSRTVCRDEYMYQKGGTNPSNNMPRILETDIETCQGYIHVVDELLLPGRISINLPPPPVCQSIVEIACETDDFSTLCSAIQLANLEDLFSEGHWTVFAPTDEAFYNLDDDVLDAILTNDEVLLRTIFFHVVDGQTLYASDLVCSHLLEMAVGDDTRTICRTNGDVFQKGKGNPRTDRFPQIIQTDTGACNGVIHVLDEVLLP